MESHDFALMSKCFRMEIKMQNTIVDKWPTRLKKQFGDPGAKEEFDLALAASHTGAERYVEWRLTPQENGGGLYSEKDDQEPSLPGATGSWRCVIM